MRHLIPVLLALAAAPLAGAAETENNAGLAAVEEIGRINGTALACAQPAIVSRARNAVATNAPKTRRYGEAFENATNAAFLQQGKGAACPEGAALSQRLEAAEKSLATALASR